MVYYVIKVLCSIKDCTNEAWLHDTVQVIKNNNKLR